MPVVEQFEGLDMINLIGAPLLAAEASLALANSTADFINRGEFDADSKLRTAEFGYQRRGLNEDGIRDMDETKADVPIPNFQIDKTDILFDMEVKQSESSKSTTDLSTIATGIDQCAG